MIFSPFTGLLAYSLELLTDPFIKKNIKPSEVKSIAALLLQGIGNNILFLPALDALRKKFPKAKITIIAKKETVELLSAYKDAKNIFIVQYPSSRPLFERLGFFIHLRKNRFDVVVYARPNRYMMPSILCFFLGKRRLLHKYPVGMHKNCGFLNSAGIDFDENISDVMNNMNLLKPLGIIPSFKLPQLKVPKGVQNKMAKFLEGKNPRKIRICIHIGCAQLIRKWPLEYFAELTNKLARNHECSIVLIGGKYEEEMIREYLSKIDVSVINAACKFSVIETVSIIKQCSLLITSDSGPQHMAVSVATPVISVYGPSSGKIDTQPVGRNDIILSLKLPCSPCVKRNSFVCPLGTHFCLKGITPDMVLKEVDKYLA